MTETEPAAVFWDIGGVIVDLQSIQAGHMAFIESLLEEYDSPLSTAEALDQWRSTLGEYFRSGEGTEYLPARAGYREAIDEILDADVDDVAWEPLFQQIHDEYAEPHDGAVETIQRLADSSLHVGVISDVDDDEGQRMLEKFGAWSSFDSFTSSEAVGYKKPDRRMFETALQKADVEGEQAVMIGDRYANDMEGADALDMTTISFGAEDGPAVDHHVEELREISALVGVSD
ncbi:HAD family hydrolase [Halovenus halobia]|uniref:HAD family hydrolase n=1 Tax=Halovenus halobia TaxID=3396622 RepID=UPI003F56A14F